MRRLYCLAMALIFLSCLAGGCGELEKPFEYGGDPGSPENPGAIHGTAMVSESVALIAGQSEEIGEITCWIEEDILYVQYSVEEGWTLCETQLAAAEDVTGIPATPSENPKVGHFPWKTEHSPPVTEYTYPIDLVEEGLSELEEITASAHADVEIVIGSATREEGAWGEGEPFRILAESEDHLEKPAVEKDGNIAIPAGGGGRGNWAKHFRINLKRLRGLLLWNKLGSDYEVTHSMVGPDGIIVGDLGYYPCTHGNGFRPLPRTGDPNIPDNYIKFPGLELERQGCVEFWYHPDWDGPALGNAATLFVYGLYNQGLYRHFQIGYSDWQNLFGLYFSSTDYDYGINELSPPSTIPEWSTTVPFHLALTWDAFEANVQDKAKLFINGAEMVPWSSGYTGTEFFDDWSVEAILFLGTHTMEGDWYRHPWEGSEGIIDNIKIWNYPKTDFSDRFEE